MKKHKFLKLSVALAVLGFAAMNARADLTSLPVDPSYLYTSINTPTIAAVGVGVGFAALWMVIRMIKKGLKTAAV